MNDRESEWARLLRAANGGDAAAYARFLRELAPSLRSLARRGLARAGRPEADAEDIVQDTLLALHLKRRTWNEGLPVLPWVRAIARYKLVDALRRSGGRKQVPIDDLADELPAAEAEPAPLSRDIGRHLHALPARQRDVVQAIAVDGRSIAEAAASLAMSEGAVRVALHRGLAALSARLRS